MAAPAPAPAVAVDLAAMREDLIGVAEQIHGVKRTARLIAEAILELKANAAKCHVDLGMYVQKAIDKGAHSAEAIEADRIRLVNEINDAEAQKEANFEQEAVNADKVLEQILAISDKGRAEYYALGGVEPEGGWDAAGEAQWTRTTETKAAERKALEDELEALAQAHAAKFAPLAPAADAGAAAGGAASTA